MGRASSSPGTSPTDGSPGGRDERSHGDSGVLGAARRSVRTARFGRCPVLHSLTVCPRRSEVRGPRHRRVAGEGEDDRRYLGPRLHRDGLDGPRARPAEVRSSASTSSTTSSPTYVVPHERRTCRPSSRAARKAERVSLATDPDREGEAIAWHLAGTRGLDDDGRIAPVVFHEITKSAVKEAFAHPREIDMDLVNAQQARRVLDRLVGYQLSPLLWSKVRRGLSAGRVQSRRRADGRRPRAGDPRLRRGGVLDGSTPTSPAGGSERQLPRRVLDADRRQARPEVCEPSAGGARARSPALRGRDLPRRVRSRRTRAQRTAGAPFTTSTLQQEASRSFGFGAPATMTVAQQLYEGVDLGGRARSA